MPKRFFAKVPSISIDKLLMDTNTLLGASSIVLSELVHYQSQLQAYLDNPKNISERTQRMIRKTLEELNARKDAETSAMDVSMTSPECLIQIPSATDLVHMTAMPAGGEEDQQHRLTHMSELILEHSSIPVRTTDDLELNENWQQLFKLMDLGRKELALTKLEKMASKDPLLQLILTIHPLEYLQTILSNCIAAHAKGYKRLNSDILITPKTFELLIKDLATSLNSTSPLYFSLGLPSHHAFSDLGTGFCLFNKTALLMKNAQLHHEAPLKYVIIGTDVNRDNGLCDVLNHTLPHLDVCHVDVFDSRVYPGQGFAEINREFSVRPKIHTTGIREWQHEKLHYYAVDLALQPRAKKTDIHPALLFALSQLKEQIKQAQIAHLQIMLFLPTGWDSHEDETAYCGKSIDGRLMTAIEAKTYRFNNQDLVYFYEQVLQLYKANKESIAGIYWGLEGGYDRAMYEAQIPLLLATLASQLKEEPMASPCSMC